MREIKFRAWDKKNKWFMDSEVYLEVDGTIYEKTNDTHDTPHIEVERANYQLMQYTGLKDKNGTEIYEGDIVKFYQASDVIGNYEVKFGEYQTELEHTLCWYAQGKPLAYAMSEAMPCEVIGNIYENPELLKQTKEDSK